MKGNKIVKSTIDFSYSKLFSFQASSEERSRNKKHIRSPEAKF